MSLCVCMCVCTYDNSKGSHIDAEFPVIFKFLVSPQTVKYVDIRGTYKTIGHNLKGPKRATLCKRTYLQANQQKSCTQEVSQLEET